MNALTPKRAKILPLVVFGLTLVWYAALVLRYPTHGVIGNDPATYVQMALDLAQHGTVMHTFSLFNNLYDRGLSWDAVITPGYHIVPAVDRIVPNYAFGFPLLLAGGYRLFGEAALYGMTQWMGLLCLLLTFALALEFWRDLTPARRYWIGALAALLLATTPRQIQLALVPMSDVPTQLFCLLAIWCALRAFQPSRDTALSTTFAFAALCGLSLGIAYLIRHSAIVLLFPLSIIVLWQSKDDILSLREAGFAMRCTTSPQSKLETNQPKSEKEFSTNSANSDNNRVALILITLFAFALTTLPDLIYRTTVLGNPFAVESPESTQARWLEAPLQIVRTIPALFSVTGFGPILLVLLVLVVMWKQKQERFAIVVLTAWILAFILFHAPLVLTSVFENSLRYLLPAYPALALLIGRAVVAIFDRGLVTLRAWRSGGLEPPPVQRGLVVLGVLVAALLFLLAIRATVGPERFVLRSYGWMSATARADLDALSRSLPQKAVIGVSDQMAGAVVLYAKRDMFRPASLREPANEFPRLLQELQTANRDVYLLGDWNCSPLAGPSESLPSWLADYSVTDLGSEVRDLPYECSQKLFSVK